MATGAGRPPSRRRVALLDRPWGSHPERVTAPVAIWSGDGGSVHPTSHARRVATVLGDVPVHVAAGAATIGLMPRYAEALRLAVGT